MTRRDDLFNTNVSIVRDLAAAIGRVAPTAHIVVISNPVNATVPIVASTLQKAGVYNPACLCGVTTLDVVRAARFTAVARAAQPLCLCSRRTDTFGSLRPTYYPGFALSWLCLVSHRLFMPKLLLSENREGWSAFHKLLLSLFKFLAPFLKEADLQLASWLPPTPPRPSS
ncbi:hypothetical protein CY34DRAFT_17670 [Suillus luteus UH-Slu-Lm8-n1]|uniref:malate dehydrogenase n=1 Tax=Suillus luteus UH-Slu-Lm8-n1 TaxID=930992 RepID=A0A0C9ZYK5_9AGAM|nr:hypothetical protein CY34DRAFT_17670 [Suillus luteus UH-Slu-Lm8-n1]